MRTIHLLASCELSLHMPRAVQLQDITQWGGPDEVARLVLPPGTRAQQLESRILKSAPKDTGTVRGTVEVAPTTIYRCAPHSQPERARGGAHGVNLVLPAFCRC